MRWPVATPRKRLTWPVRRTTPARTCPSPPACRPGSSPCSRPRPRSARLTRPRSTGRRSPGGPGTGQHNTTVTACLSSGQLTRISTAAVKCPANSAAVHWTAQSGRSGSTSQPVTVTACLSSGALTQISTTAVKCPAHSIRVRWGAQHGTAPASGPQPGPSTSTSTSPGSPSGSATSTGMPSSSSGTPTVQPELEHAQAGPVDHVAHLGADDEHPVAVTVEFRLGHLGQVHLGRVRSVEHPGRPVRPVQQRVEFRRQPRAPDALRQHRRSTGR